MTPKEKTQQKMKGAIHGSGRNQDSSRYCNGSKASSWNDAQRGLGYLDASRKRQRRHTNPVYYGIIVSQVARNSFAVQPLGASIDCSREGEALVSMLR